MFPLTNHDILSTLLAFRTIEPAPPAPAKASATRGHLPGPRWRSLCRICRFFQGKPEDMLWIYFIYSSKMVH